MSKIVFIYGKNKYYMNNTNNDISIKEILKNYIKVLGKKQNELYFLCNGNFLPINNNKKFNQIKNNHNNKTIFVFNLKKKFTIKNYHQFYVHNAKH